MLENCSLDTLSASEPLHDTSILVSDITLNHTLHSFNLVQSVVKAHDLADKLCSFRDQTCVNSLVDGLKSVSESLFHVADAMQLRVVRPHHCAVVAQKLFTTVAEVAQRLRMQHALLRLGHVRIQNRLRAEWAL